MASNKVRFKVLHKDERFIVVIDLSIKSTILDLKKEILHVYSSLKGDTTTTTGDSIETPENVHLYYMNSYKLFNFYNIRDVLHDGDTITTEVTTPLMTECTCNTLSSIRPSSFPYYYYNTFPSSSYYFPTTLQYPPTSSLPRFPFNYNTSNFVEGECTGLQRSTSLSTLHQRPPSSSVRAPSTQSHLTVTTSVVAPLPQSSSLTVPTTTNNEIIVEEREREGEEHVNVDTNHDLNVVDLEEPHTEPVVTNSDENRTFPSLLVPPNNGTTSVNNNNHETISPPSPLNKRKTTEEEKEKEREEEKEERDEEEEEVTTDQSVDLSPPSKKHKMASSKDNKKVSSSNIQRGAHSPLVKNKKRTKDKAPSPSLSTTSATSRKEFESVAYKDLLSSSSSSEEDKQPPKQLKRQPSKPLKELTLVVSSSSSSEDEEEEVPIPQKPQVLSHNTATSNKVVSSHSTANSTVVVSNSNRPSQPLSNVQDCVSSSSSDEEEERAGSQELFSSNKVNEKETDNESEEIPILGTLPSTAVKSQPLANIDKLKTRTITGTTVTNKSTVSQPALTGKRGKDKQLAGATKNGTQTAKKKETSSSSESSSSEEEEEEKVVQKQKINNKKDTKNVSTPLQALAVDAVPNKRRTLRKPTTVTPLHSRAHLKLKNSPAGIFTRGKKKLAANLKKKVAALNNNTSGEKATPDEERMTLNLSQQNFSQLMSDNKTKW